MPTTCTTLLNALLCSLCVVSAVAADGPQWVAVGAESYKGDLGSGFTGDKLGMCAVFADRVSGDAYLLGWGEGLLKSSDGGVLFTRVDDGQISGPGCGPSTGYAVQISPLGKRMAVFNMFNSAGPSGYSVDGGDTWEEYAHAMHDRDFELGAMDWDSNAVLAVPHESNNGLYFSANAGRTWTQLAKSGGNGNCSRPEILGLGVLGAQTLVVGYVDHIERSADAGKTWTKVSDFGSVGHAVRFAGRIWWLTRPGNGKQYVLTSLDEGMTWTAHGSSFPDDAGDVWFGPLFGTDESNIIVTGTKGYFETTDGCKTWNRVAPLPGNFDMKWMGCGAAYDPIHRIFYAYNRNKALMRCVRPAP